jgi:hypothetical protein
VGFISGTDRAQVDLLPACVDDYVAIDALVRVIDAFVDSLDLGELYNDANDSRLLHPMSVATKEVLEVERLQVLTDGECSNASLWPRPFTD